jgi:predicted ATPase
MRIKQLKIEGFRSLKNVTWEPGDLNILIGPNGSGKSNLLRALIMAAVAADGNLADSIQRSGGLGALVWDGQSSSIRFVLKTIPVDPVHDPEHYELEIKRLGTGSAYQINYELLANCFRLEAREKKQPFKFLERTPHRAVVFDEDEQGLIAPAESVNEDETLLSMLTGPFVNNERIPPFRQQLVAIGVYHDLDVRRVSVIRQPVVTRAESRVNPDGQNLISVLHTLYTSNREFERNIDAAMRAAFSGDYEKLVFPPAADQLIQMRVRWKTLKREQPAADLSDGTLRFLLLLTVLASPDPPPVIAIDEPETGLHPGMLPIIAEYAVDATLRAQVILTTHSPQLLDAFTDKSPTTTVAKWQDGETVLQNLSGDDLAYWLKEYTLGTLFKSGELERMS